jgi:hypothetical protein
MTRQVARDKPLSPEDREYLHARGLHAVVEQMDEDFPADAEEDAEETMPDYTTSGWTLAKLQAEVARVNEVYDVDPPLSDEGTKAEITARLTEWWSKPAE